MHCHQMTITLLICLIQLFSYHSLICILMHFCIKNILTFASLFNNESRLYKLHIYDLMFLIKYKTEKLMCAVI